MGDDGVGCGGGVGGINEVIKQRPTDCQAVALIRLSIRTHSQLS